MRPKAPGPQGLRGQQSPGCDLISGLPLRLLLPHRQLPFVPRHFVSRLLVVPQQCFTHGSLVAASFLLLSFAVAGSLKDSWAESSSPGSMGSESGNRQEMMQAFVFSSHSKEMLPLAA